MKPYLYLSLTPEALIASMLSPKDFGDYLAVGSHKRTRGQALFFELDLEQMNGDFPFQLMEERLKPHEDGKPKRSVYLSIYRVLEKTPLAAFKELYLTTEEGKVLRLQKGTYEKGLEMPLHLYQQLCPATPRVASRLSPQEIINFMTRPENPIAFPKMVFVELQLDDLAHNPFSAPSRNLPYQNINHLRDCLIELANQSEKPTKTVIRFFKGDLLYRTIKHGIFVGDEAEVLFYPFPSIEDLHMKYFDWWKSAIRLQD